MEILNLETFSQLVTLTKPYAAAVLKGNYENPGLSGTVRVYPAATGSLVVAEVFGLPPQVMENGTVSESGPFYAFHIHDGNECGQGSMPDPFKGAGTHYDTANHTHPKHSGDLPPLLGANGYAYLAAYTDRFTPAEIVGKTAIVHAHPDDLKTQPSGGAGQKIACGEIRKV